MRFMREAWVLLRRGAGDVICCKAGVESVETVLSFGAGGEQNWAVGAVLAKDAGDRLIWEAWMVFIWVTGAVLREGAEFGCGAGGGEVTSEDFICCGSEGGELKREAWEVLRKGEKVVLSAAADVDPGACGVVVTGGAEWGVC